MFDLTVASCTRKKINLQLNHFPFVKSYKLLFLHEAIGFQFINWMDAFMFCYCCVFAMLS